MQLYFGKTRVNDYASLIRAYPDQEFKNLTRSTIPMLFYWRDYQLRLKRICELVGVTCPATGALHFEYPTESLARAKPSYTDVMFQSPQLALGIEAKSTEPEYDRVSLWLTKVKRGKAVLAHWLERIGRGIDPSAAHAVVYQMIHRAASVCSVEAEKHVMVYQVFAIEGQAIDYREALQRLVDLVGCSRPITVAVHRVKLERTEFFEKTSAALRTVPKLDRAAVIRSAVETGNLFRLIDDSEVTWVRRTHASGVLPSGVPYGTPAMATKDRRDAMPIDSGAFWSPRTAEQIAADQGIAGPQSLERLTGAAADLWESDDDFEQFLASIERQRHQPSSA